MKLQTYWHALVGTFTSPHYYIDILNSKLTFTLRFYFVSYALLAVLASLIFTRFDIPDYRKKIFLALDELSAHYPSDLRITWNGSTLETNTSFPVEVRYPSFIESADLPRTLGYIAPSITSPEDFSQKLEKSSLFVVNKDSVFLNNTTSEWAKISLQDVPSFSEPFEITKQALPELLPVWKNFADNFLRTLAVAFPFFFFFILAPARLLSMLFETIFIFYFFRLLNKPIPFLKFYQLAMHVAVVAELVSIWSATMFNTTLPMFSLTFWAFFFFLSFQLWNVKSVVRIQMK